MCKHHDRKYAKKPQTPKAKFYRNLRSFLVFNLIFIVLSVMGSGFDFWKVSAIWSIFLAISYVKVFGLPGTNGWFSNDWQDWMTERESQPYTSPRESTQPNWREKDLV